MTLTRKRKQVFEFLKSKSDRNNTVKVKQEIICLEVNVCKRTLQQSIKTLSEMNKIEVLKIGRNNYYRLIGGGVHGQIG